MNDEITRAIIELRTWFDRHNIASEGLEVVIKAPSRPAYLADRQFKQDLSPAAWASTDRGGTEIAGVKIRFEKND